MTNTNLIAVAVEPLRAMAIERARESAHNFVINALAKLEGADWDVNAAAPYPQGSDLRYRERVNYRNAVMSITTTDPSRGIEGIFLRFNGPCYRKPSDEGIALLVQRAKDEAAASYEAYVSKLTQKITGGHSDAIVGASLSGDAVWSYSHLTITRETGAVEVWKTQMIINTSVHGKLFNQWPTRMLKAKK